MNMKRTLAVLGAFGIAAASQAATVTWTDGNNTGWFFQNGNWDVNDIVVKQDPFPSLVPHDLVIASNPNNNLVGGNGGIQGTLDFQNVGSLTVSGGIPVKFAATLTIKNGSVSFGNTTGANSQLQGVFDNVDAYSNWGTGLIGGLNLINGSTFNTIWFAGGNEVSTLDGGSILTIREDGAGTYNNNTVDFLDLDSKIVYSNAGRTIAEVEAEHLSRFTVNGAAAVVGDNISIYTDGVTGFTTVQAIPEPGTLSMVAAAGFCILFIRRKFML
jgi:hypothetical protein